MSLTETQVAAARELTRAWPNRKIVVIGATALGFYFDMRWRKTADVDLALAIELDEFPGPLLAQYGWLQHPQRAHEFESPLGAKVDLLPAGPTLITAKELRWPRGHRMSLAGMDLAFARAELHQVAADCSVLVAPPPVIVILKMVSYCDRPAERERDLEDITHLLDSYVDENAERRWEEAAECDFDLAPAYLLGLDLGRTTTLPEHRAVIDKFVERIGDEGTPSHALMSRRGPKRWRSESHALSRRLQAFREGMAATATK
ncbi:MAG TPA: hypothetical protein VI197_20995 [Polyangiaceae bacterium]